MASYTENTVVSDSNKNSEILKEARERFEESQDGSFLNRETAEEDIRFNRLGDQWPDEIRNQRKDEGRPCLTVNKMPSFIRQVVNDARQNKPAISISPVDNDSDVETADVISGLIRHIERNSKADVAYDTAIDNAVSCGFGFFQICIEYAHADSFDMEAVIKRISDPLSVHWDINSTEFDASDWEYAFVSDYLTEKQFEAAYPGADPVGFEDDAHSNYRHNWTKDDQVRIADYWLKQEIERKLFLLSNGQVLREDLLIQQAKDFIAAGEVDIGRVEPDELIRIFLQMSELQITQERMAKSFEVVKRVMNGVEILSEEPWPGQKIPICPVWGEEVISNGYRFFRSMTRDARDSQMMFNVMRSAGVEIVSQSPKTPWVGPAGFDAPEPEKWKYAHIRNFQTLKYDPAVGPPTRTSPPQVPNAVLQEALNSNDDMKSIIGIYDSSLGARSNETSGKAIMARQKESDVSNFHFPDNLNRAIQYAGEILVEIIPSVYGARQAVRILGEDQKEEIIKLGKAGQEANGTGSDKLYDLNTGRYDVVVKSGPSFASQREETRETLIEIMRTVPDAGQYIGDIVMEHLDFQGADRVAKRLKMILPQELQDMEDQETAGDLPPEAQAMMGQANQTIKALKQALEEAKSEKMPEMERLNIEKAQAALDEKTKLVELEIKKQELEIKKREADMKEVESVMSQEF